MNRFAFLIVLLLGTAAGAIAQTTVTYEKHNDSKGGFTIDSPAGWTKKANAKDVALELSSPDGLANYRVVVQSSGNQPANDLLSAMESQLGYETMLDPNSRTLGPKLLKPTGAQEGVVGAYSVEKNGIALNQRIWVLIKNGKAFILVETVPDDNLTDYIDIFDHISGSIRVR